MLSASDETFRDRNKTGTIRGRWNNRASPSIGESMADASVLPQGQMAEPGLDDLPG